MTESSTLPAGVFSAWLQHMRRVLAQDGVADVPCGVCTACCSASYFIHIRPEEKQVLAHIPRQLLFAAPGLPKGHKILGHFQDGRCPMLQDGRCAIYDHRPLTCRAYDCRVFPAAGIPAADDKGARLSQQARRWSFSYPAAQDEAQHAAVRVAAAFLQAHAEKFPAGFVPRNAAQLATLAMEVCPVFMDPRGGLDGDGVDITDRVRAVVEEKGRFGAGASGPAGGGENRLA